jgi:oleandomycin transport system permease protein
MMRALQQTLTLAWRSLVQIRHNPWELGDYSIQPILFLVLFVYVFGGAVAGSPDDYLEFVLPGVIVMNLVFVTVYVGHGLNSDLTKGVFDRLRSLPIPRWAPLAGRIVADLVKQVFCIALLLLVGFLLGFRLGAPAAGLLVMLVLLLAFALAFSWVMVLVGVLSKDPEHVQLFGFTALFPVTFVSNVFVPLETLPGWLQGVVAANPVTMLADTARGLLSGGPVLQPALGAMAWALAITLVFAPLSVWALNRRLESR